MATISEVKVKTRNFETFINRAGAGNADGILFLHGSGPGVSAIANWKYALNACHGRYDCIAPDLLGFGESGHPETLPKNRQGWLNLWVNQMIELLDELGIDKINLVGNSMGCSVALELLIEYPGRFNKVVLMGASVLPNPKMSPELARARGFYENPSLKNMRQIMSWFVYDADSVSEEIDSLVQTRYETAMRTEIQLSNNSIFATSPLPIPETALKRIEHPVLLVHGRDDKVCSVESSYYLLSQLPNSRLHVYSKCGHWAQIEHYQSYNSLMQSFFTGEI